MHNSAGSPDRCERFQSQRFEVVARRFDCQLDLKLPIAVRVEFFRLFPIELTLCSLVLAVKTMAIISNNSLLMTLLNVTESFGSRTPRVGKRSGRQNCDSDPAKLFSMCRPQIRVAIE